MLTEINLKLFMMQPENDMSSNIMNKQKPVMTVFDRVASRVEQVGHWIAEEDIRFRYGQSLQNLKPAIAIADQIFIIDNTNEPMIVAEIAESKLIYCIDHIPAWSADVIRDHS